MFPAAWEHVLAHMFTAELAFVSARKGMLHGAFLLQPPCYWSSLQVCGIILGMLALGFFAGKCLTARLAACHAAQWVGHECLWLAEL